MKKYIKFIVFLLLSATALQAQNKKYEYKDYTWDESFTKPTLSKEEQKESSIILKQLNVIEYVFNKEAGSVSAYKTKHETIIVNDDDGIEYNNKVYIPVNSARKVIDVKARSISKEGIIKELDKSNFMSVEKTEKYGSFVIFAIEGLSKGSIIDYYYTVYDKNPSLYKREYVQQNEIVKDYTFQLYSDKALTFKAFGVNGVGNIVDSLLKDNRQLIEYKEVDIGKQIKEQYSYPKADRKCIDYKFAYHEDNNDGEFYSWKKLGTNINKNIREIDAPTKKKMLKNLKRIGVSKTFSDEKKVKTIENYLKDVKVFNINKDLSNTDVLTAFKNKQANKLTTAKLMIALLDVADVYFEIVVTCDRTDIKFEKNNENYAYAKEFLLYFPKLNKYIEPANIAYRLGMISPEYNNNYGLFIDFDSPRVKWIKSPGHKNNYSNMDIKIDLDKIEEPEVILKNSFGGHEAAFLKLQLVYGNTENKQDLVNNITKMVLGEDANILSSGHQPVDKNKSSIDESVSLNAKCIVPSLIENAGNDYIFNIGNIIGEQVEMYQETERKNNAEISFPHEYTRKISFQVPEGYKVEGLEDLTMNVVASVGKKKVAGFTSTYTFEGNIITIKVYEYYVNTTYPLVVFEDFRKVINAAADFNKIVIVFSPK